MVITLIGMSGAGKSFIGKKLASRLGYGFIDTDDLIEQWTGCPLQDIINRDGEEAFLDAEEEAVTQLGEMVNTVLATGGSVVYRSAITRFLKENTTIVFLDAPFALVKKRLEGQLSRGIIGIRDTSLNTLFVRRRALYQEAADISIRIAENDSAEDIVTNIIKQLKL